MATAFLSYSSKDQAVTIQVRDWLEVNDVRCWFAPRDTLPGEAYGASISEAIIESSVLVVVVSANALASEHVQREVTIAVSNNVPIIPLRIDEAELRGQLAYALAQTHRIDATVPLTEENFKALLRGIERFAAKRAALTSSTAAARLDARGALPPVLVYLVDRREQERDVLTALRMAWESRSSHALVFLVHGPASECLDGFMDRLHEVSLPKFLRQSGRLDQVRRLELSWPHRAGDVAGRRTLLHDELAERLAIPLPASEDDLRSHVARNPGLLSAVYHLQSTHWRDDEVELMRGWLAFWGTLVVSLAQSTVCVFLNVQYHVPTSFLRAWRARRVHAHIRADLLQLVTRVPVPVTLVQELAPIDHVDVEEWVRTHGRQHAGVRDVDTLIRAVRGMFGDDGDPQPLSMSRLRERLPKLVSEHQ